MSHGLLGSHSKDRPPERLPTSERYAGVRLAIVEARGLASKVSEDEPEPGPGPGPEPGPEPQP